MNGAGNSNQIIVYNRATGECERETVMAGGLMDLAYTAPFRPLCRLTVFRLAFFSRLLGWYFNTAWSRRRIPTVARQLQINVDECLQPLEEYRTFNEFFVRKLKPDARPCDPDPKVLSAPADARYFVFDDISETTRFKIKGLSLSAAELLGCDAAAAAEFANGVALVARLCPADYHRYHYPASGWTLDRWAVPGRLDSVNPVVLARGIRALAGNRRRVVILDLDRFGRTAFVEIGAFGVEAIVQTHTADSFAKMDEKGYFAFGASSIVVLMQANALRWDDDLREQTEAGRETFVRAGDQLGVVSG